MVLILIVLRRLPGGFRTGVVKPRKHSYHAAFKVFVLKAAVRTLSEMDCPRKRWLRPWQLVCRSTSDGNHRTPGHAEPNDQE